LFGGLFFGVGPGPGYVQDVRYFAKEHMDVRREAYQVRKAYQVSCIANLTSVGPDVGDSF